MAFGIGNRIKTERLALGISQRELAEAISNFIDRRTVGRTTVTQWELGIVQEIESGNLLKAARILNVSAEWLRFGTGKKECDPDFLKDLPMVSSIIKHHFILPRA